MTIKSLNTVLHVHDYEGCLTLFRDALGFALLRSWDAEESRGTILQATDHAEIELIAPPEGTQWDSYSTGVQISLNVDDADAYYERLSSDARVAVNDPIGDRPFGVRSFGIQAPDGIQLYLVERLPGNPAYRP